MCGIFALIYGNVVINNNEKFKRHVLKSAQKLRHRGPDGTGYHQTRYGCFAHERLSIIDPEGGNQPLLNTDQTLVLCVNGEIFNYKDLKLKYSDYPYKTGSDCEVILAIFSKLLEKENDITHEAIVGMLEQLDGQFSFVLHDINTTNTLVVRDPFGITQLYYGMDKYGNFEIASEMKALDKCIRVEPMPPGHYMYFDINGNNIFYNSNGKNTRTPINYFADTNYGQWSVRGYEPSPYDSKMLEVEEEAKLCKDIRHVFEQAVFKRLMTDVPFGVLLSGGLDSSLVASCTMSYMRQHPEKYGVNPELHTFSIGLKGAPDLKYARVVADFLGTKHHEINFTVEEGLNALHDVIYHLETYDITTIRASTGMYLLTRKIQSLGIKMVLSGEGSDELLGGYLYYHQAPNDEEHQLECKKRLLALSYFDCLRADKSTMANSVEGRYPFLDVAFVDLCLRIHKDVKCQKGIEKYILRKAFDDGTVLPADVLWRQKMQFSDGVGYSWIDKLKEFTDNEVTYKHLVAYYNKEFLYPFNTPPTTEAFYYRMVFDAMFPDRANTVKYWVPNTAWTGVSADPSGRVQLAHRDD